MRAKGVTTVKIMAADGDDENGAHNDGAQVAFFHSTLQLLNTLT